MAIDYAAWAGHINVCDLLVSAGSIITDDLLHSAACYNQLGFLKHIQKMYQLNLNGVFVNNWTVLHRTARDGDLDISEYLIEHGADVNAKDKWGWTPLHETAYYGYPEICELLIEHGADVNFKDEGGNTPLHYAAEESHQLHNAARWGHLKISRRPSTVERHPDCSTSCI